MNCRMPDLRAAFEAAGFTEVKTLLSSGNVVFDTKPAAIEALQKKCEAAMAKTLGKSFLTIVRPVESLRKLLDSDPYGKFRLAPGAKRIVTFLRSAPTAKVALPIELHGARILAIEESEVFSAYSPTPKGPVFMTLIEKAFGKEQTTRTWQTVEKAAGC